MAHADLDAPGWGNRPGGGENATPERATGRGRRPRGPPPPPPPPPRAPPRGGGRPPPPGRGGRGGPPPGGPPGGPAPPRACARCFGPCARSPRRSTTPTARAS